MSNPFGTNYNASIKTWKQFTYQVRPRGCKLLTRLGDFPDAILIAGCQRSGTTMLSRIITESDGMTNFWFGRDDELAAALILSGEVEYCGDGRHCFQTTYINECFEEYQSCRTSHKMVWVIRNPYSVVCSFLYNWRSFALNDLFSACGLELSSSAEQLRYRYMRNLAVSRIRRASLNYNGKLSQLFILAKGLENIDLMVVDYDQLVDEKSIRLAEIYKFLELPYSSRYMGKIHSKSIKKANRLSFKEKRFVEELCIPVYERASKLNNKIFPSRLSCDSSA